MYSVPSLMILFLLCYSTMADLCKGGGIFSEGISRFDEDIQQKVKALTLKQKIGQIMQLNIDMVGNMVDGSFQFNEVALQKIIEEYGVGSFLNSPLSGGTSGGISQLSVEQWQGIIQKIQDVSLEFGPKIPSIYGLDSIHGANYVRDATMFPQSINAGASFNRELVELQGHITAKDTRASGIPWLFAPILGIALQPQWPRVFETFGEDPYVVSELGKTIIKGMQGYPADLSNLTRGAACMKHFIAYSNPRSGHDRTPAWIPERFLYQYFLPSFQAAVDVGVATAMESYGDVNGVPIASSYEHTICLLRDEMKWDGMMVTDWSEIKNLHNHHRIASTMEEAVRLSMEGTSIDMSMIPDSNDGYEWFLFSDTLEKLANENSALINRIEESAARVIKLKRDLGLFDDPYGFSDPSVVGTHDDKMASLNLARESIILAENHDSVLPLDPANYTSILVVGPTGDSLALQNGGWTIHWQGAFGNWEFQDGSTITSGISDIFQSNPDANVTVTYMEGCDTDGNIIDLDNVLIAATKADLIVVALGEKAYTEVPGDIDDIHLPEGQEELLDQIADVTDTTIILVLLEGRPRVLRHAPDVASATLMAWLPGPYGGQAIAEIIFGLINPSAKFPMTYHSSANSILVGPYWHTHSSTNTLQASSMPRWEFGYGLSYSTYSYSPIELSTTALTSLEHELQINVDVTNQGPYDGKEIVLLFIGQDYRIIAPEIKMLKRFEKIDLKVGETKTVSFSITAKDDLFFYAEKKTKRYEDGWFTIDMTSGEAIRKNPATITAHFKLETGKHPATFVIEERNVQPINQGNKGVFTSTEAGGYLVLTFLLGGIITFVLMKFLFNFQRRTGDYEDIDMSHEYRQK